MTKEEIIKKHISAGGLDAAGVIESEIELAMDVWALELLRYVDDPGHSPEELYEQFRGNVGDK